MPKQHLCHGRAFCKQGEGLLIFLAAGESAAGWGGGGREGSGQAQGPHVQEAGGHGAPHGQEGAGGGQGQHAGPGDAHVTAVAGGMAALGRTPRLESR